MPEGSDVPSVSRTVCFFLITLQSAFLLTSSLVSRLLLARGYPKCTPELLRVDQTGLGKLALPQAFDILTLIRLLTTAFIAICSLYNQWDEIGARDFPLWISFSFYYFACGYFAQLYYHAGVAGGRRKMKSSFLLHLFLTVIASCAKLALNEAHDNKWAGVPTSNLCDTENDKRCWTYETEAILEACIWLLASICTVVMAAQRTVPRVERKTLGLNCLVLLALTVSTWAMYEHYLFAVAIAVLLLLHQWLAVKLMREDQQFWACLPSRLCCVLSEDGELVPDAWALKMSKMFHPSELSDSTMRLTANPIRDRSASNEEYSCSRADIGSQLPILQPQMVQYKSKVDKCEGELPPLEL